MAKKTTITNGIRPYRYIFAFICFLTLSETVNDGEFDQFWFILFLISLLIFGALYMSRRIQFDENHVYKKFGMFTETIEFSSLVSITRSKMKLGGRFESNRMWKITYKNEEGKEKAFRFVEGNFQHGSIDALCEAVQKSNYPVKILKDFDIWTNKPTNF